MSLSTKKKKRQTVGTSVRGNCRQLKNCLQRQCIPVLAEELLAAKQTSSPFASPEISLSCHCGPLQTRSATSNDRINACSRSLCGLMARAMEHGTERATVTTVGTTTSQQKSACACPRSVFSGSLLSDQILNTPNVHTDMSLSWYSNRSAAQRHQDQAFWLLQR